MVADGGAARLGTRGAARSPVAGWADTVSSVTPGSSAAGATGAARMRSRTTSNGSLTASGSAMARNPSIGPRYRVAPLLEIEHAVRPEPQRLLDPVLDDDDRVAPVRQGSEDVEQALGGRRIEVGERLVDDVQPGLHHQDPGHRQQLALAARQGRRLAAEEGLDPGAVGDVPDAVADLLARDAHVLRTERQLGLDRGPDDLLGRILEDGPDGPGDVAQLQLGRGPALDPNGAAELARVGVRDQAVDGADERALAAAGRPGDQEDLARARPSARGPDGGLASRGGSGRSDRRPRRAAAPPSSAQAGRIRTGRSTARPRRAGGVALVVGEREVPFRIRVQQRRAERHAAERLLPDRPLDDRRCAVWAGNSSSSGRPERQRADGRLQVGGRAGEGEVAEDQDVDDDRAEDAVADGRRDDRESDAAESTGTVGPTVA